MPAKKQITKQMILNAALELLKEQGYDEVNIKQLAKKLGCSTQPVYFSFSGMQELRKELLPLAVKEFEVYMKKDNTDDRINLYDRNYIRFAMDEPRLFCYLFMRAKSYVEIKQTLTPLVERSVKGLMASYGIDHEEADVLHDQLWMHAHGIASMIATDFCDWDLEKAEMMLENCKKVFTEKYEARDVYK